MPLSDGAWWGRDMARETASARPDVASGRQPRDLPVQLYEAVDGRTTWRCANDMAARHRSRGYGRPHWSRAMSTQAGAMPDSYPVQWTGRLAILALPRHVGDCNAGQIREQLLWVINRGAAELIIDMTGT